MQQWYPSWFQQNTSAECSAKAAVDECGKVAFAFAAAVDSRPTERPGWSGPAGPSERRRQCGPANRLRLAPRSTTRPPWVVSWVEYLSLLQPPLYSSYRIPLNYLSYGPGTAVNSQLSFSPCSYLSSMIPTSPFTPCRSTHVAFPSILVGILLYNYYLCVVTDPGVVPHNWVRNALPQRAFFTYASSFRNQNSMTLMAMRSRSCLVPQGIVACARNTNHRAHITARRAKGMRPRFAILLSEYWFPPPVDACFAWVSIHTIDS
jgi:hypothetical protein